MMRLLDPFRKQKVKAFEDAMRDGDILSALERFEQAAEAYSQAINIERGNSTAHFKLGMAYAGMHRYGEATDSFRSAVNLNPGDAVALYNVGVALGEMGRYDEAISALVNAIQIDPEDAEAHCNLGVAYEATGQHEKAAREYELAIRTGLVFANEVPEHALPAGARLL